MKVGKVVRLTSRLLTGTTGERVVPFTELGHPGGGAHYEVPGGIQMETPGKRSE